MNAFDVLAQQLNAMSSSETLEWLRKWVAPDSMGHTMMYGHDSTPALVLQRIMPQLSQRAQNNLAMETGMLLEEFFAQPRVGIDYAGTLLRVAEKVAQQATATVLASQLDRFPLWNPLAVQVALSIIIDAKAQQSIEFWRRVQAMDPASFSGFAMNALLDININEGAELIPVLAHNNTSSNLTALILDLKYDQLNEQRRHDLVAAVSKQVQNCTEAARSPLQSWVDSKQ